MIRAAIDHAHVKPRRRDRGRARDRVLPADDRRLSPWQRTSCPVTIRLQREDFDIAARDRAC